MSIVFSNSTSGSGLIEMLDQAVGTDNNKWPLAQKTAKINLALDEALATIFKISKSGWQFDANSGEPSISANLVSGTSTYDFSEDAGGNLVLDVYRVLIKSKDDTWNIIDPIDPRTESDNIDGFFNAVSGTPARYQKYGTTIVLDPKPDYDKTSGLKLLVNRESAYFSVSSTSQVAGIDGLCHDFLYLKPAYEWARDHGLQNAERLFRDMTLSKQKIETRYGTREKDRPKRIVSACHNMK
jgi:hypothetical protein